MNRSAAAAPQPLRGMPGNVFQNQQQQPQSGGAPRNPSVNSARLQNGKIAGPPPSSGWNFGMNVSGASGAPGSQQQSRTTSNNLSSFAQTIGGSHSQASLDPSEFPSLSGAPQPQQQLPSSQIWGSPAVRMSQNAPVQRPPPQNANQPSASQRPLSNPLQSRQPHTSREDSQSESQTSPFGQITSGMDNMRLDEGARYGQGMRSLGAQDGGDDFPPLGGLGDMAGSSGVGAGPSNRRLGPTHTTSGQMSHAPIGQPDSVSSPAGMSNGIGSATARSPFDQESAPDSTRMQGGMGAGMATSIPPGMGGSARQQESRQASGEYDQQAQPDSASAQQTPRDAQPLSSMSDADKWGLKGLIATLKGEYGPDQASLAYGMDLTNLGLNLQQPDNAPLYQSWAGPFADPSSRPMIPDFTLPAAYTVQNVPPLQSKMGSFSEETLFAIFYQCPRDQAQEWAANELYARDWRWHMKLRQWMMKAKEMGEPHQLPSMREERGWYVFFDVNNWRRDRKEFILNYEHLYHIPQHQYT